MTASSSPRFPSESHLSRAVGEVCVWGGVGGGGGGGGVETGDWEDVLWAGKTDGGGGGMN